MYRDQPKGRGILVCATLAAGMVVVVPKGRGILVCATLAAGMVVVVVVVVVVCACPTFAADGAITTITSAAGAITAIVEDLAAWAPGVCGEFV